MVVLTDVRQNDANATPDREEVAVRKLPCRFLLFSCEAYGDIAYTMTEIFRKIGEATADLQAADFGDEIEEILITPICMPDSLAPAERKFVSHQNKYADMRLRISYTHFKQATPHTKLLLCLQAIFRSLAIVDARTHKNGFRGKALTEELRRRFLPAPPASDAGESGAAPGAV